MKIKVTASCVYCGRSVTVTIEEELFDKWRKGYEAIQDIMPDVSPDDREIFISNICGSCFDKLFED